MAKDCTPLSRGKHCLNIHVSYAFKERLIRLAARYDRTLTDMVRAIIKVGMPVMEGISEAEEKMVKEYVHLFRKLRQIKNLKDY